MSFALKKVYGQNIDCIIGEGEESAGVSLAVNVALLSDVHYLSDYCCAKLFNESMKIQRNPNPAVSGGGSRCVSFLHMAKCSNCFVATL